MKERKDPGGFISIPVLKQFLRQAEVCGVESDIYLQSASISREMLDDNSGRISGEQLEQLLTGLIEASKDPCFGLNSARYVQAASYSVLGYIALNCATVREVLELIPKLERVAGDTGVTSIREDGDYVLQLWDCRFHNTNIRRHVIEHVIGSEQYFARQLLGFTPPVSVHFEHSAPQGIDIDTYKNIFACDVYFDQGFNAVRMLGSALDAEIPGADPLLLQTLVQHASATLKDTGEGQRWLVQTRNVLRLSLAQGKFDRESVAASLGLSGRTLQRKLIDEGTHFQALLSELRLETARSLLIKTNLSMSEIARQLGYSEERSLYRFFKEAQGMSPGDYRQLYL